ncbi:alpha/beta hydrolase [Spirillospora sp. CA-294931]|uniref:alpha/beta hydrolase n=1 Tax=Spirillospora sp. CA-294931 TaxID=3240042 RepID=UPI003D92A005
MSDRAGRDPEHLAFMRRRLAAPPPAGRGIDAARRHHAADLARSPRVPVARVQDLTLTGPAGPLPARLYDPEPTRDASPALVYLHGGGWALGDVDSYDPVVRALAAASGVAFVSVGYRRPPEDPFPAALDDTVAALTHVRGHATALGLDPARVGVAGDSAGAQLAAAATLRLRGTPDAPAAQLLIYPALDLRTVPDPQPDPDGLRFPHGGLERVVRTYLRGADPADPHASPLAAPDLTGLPPAVIAAAEHDPLAAQAHAYTARLRDAGVPVALIPGTGLDHGYLGWTSFTRAAADAVTAIGAATRTLL